MTKFLGLLSIALTSLLLVAAPSTASCSKPLLIGYTDWHRGANDLETEKKFSIDLELSERILKRTDCQFQFKALPMPRLLKAIEHGEIDGTMGASLTPERQAYAWFSVPYRNEEIVMFMRKEDVANFWPVSHVELATSGLRIGMGMGAWYGPEYTALRKADPAFDASILRSDKLDIVFGWLLQKRVDIVVNELYTGLYQLNRKNALADVDVHSFLINSDPVHIMLSQKTITLDDVIVINKAIKNFRASNEYARILSQYRILAER